MLRTQLLRTTRSIPIRAVMATRSVQDQAGSVGGTRSGGSASSDSFNKREKAAEDMYMKQREAEKLKALRKMLEEQRDHIDEIEKHINKLEDETNGKK